MPDKPSSTSAKTGRVLLAVLLLPALAMLLVGAYSVAYIAFGQYIDWRVSPYPEDRTELVERNIPKAGWRPSSSRPQKSNRAGLAAKC